MSSELELHAFIDYRCRALGAQHLAYPPVVAAGPNATIVHYTHSAQALDRRSLVLVDAGCELHGYTSDITRAWPGGGAKFSDPQRAIYEVSNKMMQFSTQYIFTCGGRPAGLLLNQFCSLIKVVSKVVEGRF